MTATATDYQLANEEALREVRKALEQQGHIVEDREHALRCEIKLGEEVTGYAFFVSAPFVFSLDKQPTEDPDHEEGRSYRKTGLDRFGYDFKDFQYNLMASSFSGPPRRDCYLFVIGSESFIQQGIDVGFRAFIEADTSVGRKFVATLPQALAMLSSPFPVRREAGVKPTFDVIQELLYLNADAPDVTDALTVRNLDAELDPRHLSSPACADLRARIEWILLRVMGTEYQVIWDAEDVLLGRRGDTHSIPVAFASSGEQAAFSFAYFLAKLAETANPQIRVGIYGALSRLSLLWFLGALDALREFCYATGASLRLQIPQHDRRSLTKLKFEKITTVLDTARVPYN